MHDTIRVIHIQTPILIAERMPGINEHNIGSANLRQHPIDMLRAGDSFEDRIYSWYDGIGCRRHGLRRGGDDISTGIPFDAERPNPLDISGYHLGRHCVDGDAALFSQFNNMNTAVYFSETKNKMISGIALKRIGDSELSENVARHSSKFVDVIDSKPKRTCVAISDDDFGH